MQALVWLCLVWIRAVRFGTSYTNFRWLHIFKRQICGRNLVLHWSKYGICRHYGHVCCMFSKARYNLQILSEMTWPVADGQHYLISGNIFFFWLERFQCVRIAESKSVPLSTLIWWTEDPSVLFEVICRQFHALDGRKSVKWYSSSVCFRRMNFKVDIRRRSSCCA